MSAPSLPFPLSPASHNLYAPLSLLRTIDIQHGGGELSRLTLSLFIQQHIEAGWVSDGKGTSVPEGGLTERPWGDVFMFLKEVKSGGTTPSQDNSV